MTKEELCELALINPRAILNNKDLRIISVHHMDSDCSIQGEDKTTIEDFQSNVEESPNSRFITEHFNYKEIDFRIIFDTRV